MRAPLLQELMIIFEEEQRYLNGETQVIRGLNTKDRLGEIDREQLLQRRRFGQAVQLLLVYRLAHKGDIRIHI